MNPLAFTSTGMATCACLAAPLAASGQEFDAQTLKRLGISPDTAAYFSKKSRFLPGITPVRLVVNGVDLGTLEVRFDEEGVLCFTPELLQRAGLKASGRVSEDACHDYRDAYPETDILQKPNQSQVEIVTPLSARAPTEESIEGQYSSGGTAAVFNYAISGAHSGGDTGYGYLRAYSETGLNAAGWILRSRQDYFSQGRRTALTQGNTYVQRAIPSKRATFQAGQISPVGSLFSIGTLRGVQLFPEYALRRAGASGVGFEGVASGQSRIEVRQFGTLVLMTQVPAGPYTISDVPIISPNTDLDVMVISAGGEQQQFVVSAATFGASQNNAAQGLSVAIGQYQSYRGSESQAPVLATASNGWNLGRHSSLNAGILLSRPYRAVAATFITSPTESINGSFAVRASHSRLGGNSLDGQQVSAGVSFSPWERIAANLSATWQTQGYLDIGQVVQRSESAQFTTGARLTYNAGLSWSQPELGAISANFSVSRSGDVGAVRKRASLSWSRSFLRASVTLSAARDFSNDAYARPDNQYFLTLSLPIGRASAGVYAAASGDSNSIGVSYSDTVTPQFGYNLSSSVANPGGRVASSLSVNALPRYAQVNLSANRDAQGGTSTNWEIRGAVVAAAGGVVFSPYEVGDTFGIAKVGRLAGVEIQSPTGSTWTDAWGRAVLPALPAYTESSVEINTASLPRSANLPNGIQSAAPARGTVQIMDFNLRSAQRYLLSAVRESDQRPLVELQAVIDGRGDLVTLVGKNGRIFLDSDYVAPLHVSGPDGKRCLLEFTTGTQPDPDLPYEAVQAICREKPPTSSVAE
ncbi:fimbria/pilus outer membrane usher protein [Stenotrophomonas geniculata]|uniref:fimbria/pilus outer membrane usher protein n=1 Tax=Stenotrophomonas geniculata TaxID=86188 RepID=UPI003AACD1F4